MATEQWGATRPTSSAQVLCRFLKDGQLAGRPNCDTTPTAIASARRRPRGERRCPLCDCESHSPRRATRSHSFRAARRHPLTSARKHVSSVGRTGRAEQAEARWPRPAGQKPPVASSATVRPKRTDRNRPVARSRNVAPTALLPRRIPGTPSGMVECQSPNPSSPQKRRPQPALRPPRPTEGGLAHASRAARTTIRATVTTH